VIESIDQYLGLLKQELSGSDRATIQDALADAQEHLSSALDHVREMREDVSEADALQSIVQEYGSPEETAMAYKEIEARTRPALARTTHEDDRPFVTRFFAVLADPRAWGALLYMLISLLTGTIYFTWVVTGLSVSLSLIILIFGMPIAVLFMLSFRGVALVEGLLVEALLGVRMPRRRVFSSSSLGWWERFKVLVAGKRTWLAIAYMLLLFPLGVLYFTVFVTLIAVSLSFIATPVLEFFFDVPLVTFGDTAYRIPGWLTLLIAFAGVLLLPATMHLAKLVGRAHGTLAKAMLVSD
jgi:uncharacterized membrane protein